MSAFLDQQRRKAFAPEPRDWETTRRALIESGMVADSRARRFDEACGLLEQRKDTNDERF